MYWDDNVDEKYEIIVTYLSVYVNSTFFFLEILYNDSHIIAK